MSATLIRKVTVDGWDLDVGPDDEARVRDLDLAERLGMAKPRDIRALIDRNRAELENHGTIDMRRTVRRISKPHGGYEDREVAEYYPNEAQALTLCMLARTTRAAEVRVAMTRVFIAYRRGLLRQAVPVALDVAHGPRVGEHPELRTELAAHCRMVARASGRSLEAIHGYVRRLYRVPGVYHLSVLLWPLVRETLTSIALDPARLLPPPPRALPANVTQLQLWKESRR